MEKPTKETAAILSQFVLPNKSGQRYPALQATDYQPKNLKAEIHLGIGVESLEMLTEEAQEKLAPELVTCDYKNGPVPIYLMNGLRWVILGSPGLFIFMKDTERYRAIIPGEKLKDTKNVTAARLYLAVIKDGELILDEDGSPQVFTLLLRSNQTNLIKARRPEKGDGTIYSLNEALSEHYQLKGVLTHTVSVEMDVFPTTRSNASGTSSFAVMYRLGESAKVLPEAQLSAIHKLITSDDFKLDMVDPFRLGSAAAQSGQIHDIGDDLQPF